MKQTVCVALMAVFCAPLAWNASVTGTVVDDASGTALPKADVVIYTRPDANRFHANNDGTFQSGDLAPGDYRITAWHAGYVYGERTLHIGNEAASPQSPLIRLVRLGAIEGQLTGLRARSAKVLAMARSENRSSGEGIWKPLLSTAVSNGGIARGAEVNANGNFRIPDLPPGTYALVITYNGESAGLLRYPDGNGGFELTGDGGTLKVQIPIPSGAGRTIEGQIELPDTESWYWVTLSRPDQPALAVATTTSGLQGEFAFHGVAPGTYELLVIRGTGEKGMQPSSQANIYTGARMNVDIRERDARGITIAPRAAIGASVALQELTMRQAWPVCLFTSVRLTPIEDWGINVERFLPSITITQEGRAPSREYPDGLAPARYGLSSENSDCLIAGRPLLDLSNAWAGIIEVKVTTPGVIRGHAAGSVGQSTEWEVILIPDDFTEGWAYLPARWFSESVFGAELLFQAQGAHRPRAYVPHVRMSALDGVGHFEFTDVPAGNYRIGMRSTVTGPALVGWRDMNRVEVPSGGIAETVVAIPESSAK